MSSKFIPQKGSSPYIKSSEETWSTFSGGWNNPSKEERKAEIYAQKQFERKKVRLQKMPLSEISFLDVYEFPLTLLSYGNHVWDAEGNMVFQFEKVASNAKKLIVDALNSLYEPQGAYNFKHENGEIFIEVDSEWKHCITIRGWGGLTGIGGYNLDSEKACKIQDTFADWIVSKLTEKLNYGKY